MSDHTPTGRGPCPDERDLAGFLRGALTVPSLEWIAAHLSICSDCDSAIGRLDEAATAPGALLCRLGGPIDDSFPSGPEYRRMVAGAARAFSVTPVPPDPPPTRLDGRYQIGERLGRGGMGMVYRGEHLRLKRPVAVKLLPTAADAKAVARFQREMEVAARLDHPNIVQTTDGGEADGVHFLVMELVDGTDLARLPGRVGPLSVADACELIRQAAAGLQHAHDHGLVHRDVKPSNLMLSRAAQVKVLDLGLVLRHSDRLTTGGLTGSKQVIGTADYMAPEQWDAGRRVDGRADVYGLGCTLYYLLTGRPPFGAPEYPSLFKKMGAHARAPIPLIQTARPDVPAVLAAVLARLLAKNPENRFPTPGDVARELRPLSAGADLRAVAQAMPVTP